VKFFFKFQIKEAVTLLFLQFSAFCDLPFVVKFPVTILYGMFINHITFLWNAFELITVKENSSNNNICFTAIIQVNLCQLANWKISLEQSFTAGMPLLMD